jgi:uncharacterized protein (DUF1800 family)
MLGAVCLSAFVGLSSGTHAAAAAREASPPPDRLSARDSALHVLQRFAYGPRPGEVEQIARQGAMAWLEGQLALQERDDRVLAARERSYRALALGSREWATTFVAMREATQRRKQQMTTSEATSVRPDSTFGKPGANDKGARPDRTPEQAEFQRLLEQVHGLTMVRAVRAQVQLREVMTDFWFNHFNVYLDKGPERFMLADYVEHVIRPRVLGRFEDLLVATARSPAMLFYLDNVESVAPPEERPGGFAGATPARQRGINENYARELMELHTLGVDGGYTQKDVTEVARILTGWGMTPPREGADFMFHPRLHDYGEKIVLGVTFPAGHGEDEGQRLLHLLARHPATIRHVCRQLCVRFVSDDPPDGCIDAAVAAWQKSDGDLRQVLRAIVRSPDFWDPAVVNAKVKTPLEFVVSAARALGADPDSTPRLANAVARLGQPLYRQPSPAGYPERQSEWVNSGALLARMNFAVALAGGNHEGTDVDLNCVLAAVPDHDALVDSVNERVLAGTMTPNTRRVILEQIADLSDPRRARALAIGLALGSPEFQRQ